MHQPIFGVFPKPPVANHLATKLAMGNYQSTYDLVDNYGFWKRTPLRYAERLEGCEGRDTVQPQNMFASRILVLSEENIPSIDWASQKAFPQS